VKPVKPATPVAPPTPSVPSTPAESTTPATPDEPPLPTPEELAAAPDATIRHAPKFGAFIAAGAVVGFLVGLLLTALVAPRVALPSDGSGFLPFLDGENAVRTWMAVAGAVFGGFVGGLCAVLADRRSVRRAGRDRG
jgi:hypothetical protein